MTPTRWKWHTTYPLPTGQARLMGVMRWVFAALAAMDLVLFVVMVIREPGGEEMWLDALGVLGMGALAAINVIVYRRHQDALAAQASGMFGP